MSATNREVAHRVFAAEYDDATFSYSESDEERAPNYVVTPSGARINRVFFVGVLTEVEQVSDDVLRARIADPTGAFVVYAGQYQPDEMAFLEEAEPPLFVAVTGKARTFSPDDSDLVYTSVRPESINEVDAGTRDRWTVQAAEQTLARVATARAALDLGLEGDALREALRESGVSEGVAAGIPMAFEQYGTTEHYLAAMADLAVDSLELVAGEADEVPTPSVTPGDAGSGTVDANALAEAVDGAVVDLGKPDESVEREEDATSPVEGGDDGDTTGGASAADESAAASSASTDDAVTGDDTDVTDEVGAAGDEGPTDDEGATDDTDELGDFESGGVSASGESGAPESEESRNSAERSSAGGSSERSSDDGSTDERSESVDVSTDDADVADDEAAAADSEAATDDPVEDALGDEERQRIEEEYGTDFSTGAEVEEPGEADIEPEAGPIEPEDLDESSAESPAVEDSETGVTSEPQNSDASEAEATTEEAPGSDEPEDSEVPDEPEPAEVDESGATAEPTEADEPAEADEPSEDVDIEAATLETMEDLDDGDGADREQVVAAVVGDHGVDPGTVEDAIQDALMAGKCYEPADGKVKPI